MVSILINKDVFKYSYNEFTVWNRNDVCTNLTASESVYSYCGEAMTSLCTGHTSPLLSYSRPRLPHPLSLTSSNPFFSCSSSAAYKCSILLPFLVPYIFHGTAQSPINPSQQVSLRDSVCVGSVTQSCLTLCDPMDCSPPGSSVHRIPQARILEWGATAFLQGIFPTQGSNPGLPPCRRLLYQLSHQRGPFKRLIHQFSHSVMSDSLRPHEPQHARPPCLSPTAGVYPNSCLLRVMLSNHLILCRPLFFLPSIFLSIRVFSNESVLHIRWPKYWEFQLQHHSF